MRVKRLGCILLAAALICCAVQGCGSGRKTEAFEAENEIITYQRIDPQKTQIVVSRTGNIEVEPFCRAFEAENPDVQIVYVDITGGSSGYQPLVEWIKRGYKPDIVFSTASYFDSELAEQCFVNLSTNPVIQNYEAEALKNTAIDDNVYFLPGPSNISAMMYNKTLFERYGWELPRTFDEFVALCRRITEDTGGEVEPWNPNAKYDVELLTALEALNYEKVLGGAENRAWYNAFVEGRGEFTGHMEPYFETLQMLVDNGILREEHFTYSATTRGKEFAAGRIAMINMNIYEADNDEFNFGYMPFPTTEGELGYLCNSYSCYVGVTKKEYTEKESDAIERFLNYFSSAEGQRAYIGATLKVSNVNGVPLDQSDDMEALQAAIDAGHMFAVMDFNSPNGASRTFNFYDFALKITTGETTGAECIAEVDGGPYSEAAEPVKAPEVIAAAAKDMTILETSFYMADAYRERADADIGLIANNAAYRGNMMRIFSGDITAPMVTVLKPRSLANDSTLVKLSMTGRQIMDALNSPVGNDGVKDCIYAYSGLKCTVAPWNRLGTKYITVKLSDGSELEENKLYTVAAWAGTIADEYISDTLETYEGTWEELMTGRLKADGTVTPTADGRIRLIWD